MKWNEKEYVLKPLRGKKEKKEKKVKFYSLHLSAKKLKKKGKHITGTCSRKVRRIYYFMRIANKSFASLGQVSC